MSDDNIQIAAGDGRLQAVTDFVSAGVSPDSGDDTGYTALHAASSYNQSEVLEWLLAHGGSAGVVDFDGDTPLHVCEGAASATLLLAAGAALDAKNGAGEVAFAVATKEHRDEVVECLRAVYVARGLPVPEVELSDDEDDDDDDENDGEDEPAAAAAAAAAAQSQQ